MDATHLFNKDAVQTTDDAAYGRARVQDSEELVKYYEDLAKFGSGALWKVANKIEPWEPHTTSDPMLWRYEDLRPLVLKSSELVTPEQAGRRVVYLINPKRAEMAASVGWLYSGLQVTRPGESTPAHRHNASALRFIMEGAGGYTVVNGNKINLGVNDFVITPNSAWHEHGVVAEGKTCIWQDGLDIPLVNALEANNYAVLPEGKGQDLLVPIDHSPMTYSGAGLLPMDLKWNHAYSPLFRFGWEPTYEALLNAAKVNDPDPYDGIILQYANPATGGHVMPTMGAAMQLLHPKEHTKAHKHTGSIMYQCCKGQGYTIINGKKFEWKKNDIFCVPSWSWHEHCNTSINEDACLFQFNDLPVIQALQLYQTKLYPENNGYQHLI